MDDRVKLIDVQTLANDWGTLSKATLEVRRRDGTWQHQTRESYDHGHAAALLLLNPHTGMVILTRQFRYPVYASNDPAWLIEVCAGLLDDDDPLSAIIREAIEETGYRPTDIVHAYDAYMSPGSLTEKLSLFIGHYHPDIREAAGGGLAHEGEDIEVIEMPLSAALAMIARGDIIDAKTIMLLQWAALHRPEAVRA